jgi:hypothetical protein
MDTVSSKVRRTLGPALFIWIVIIEGDHNLPLMEMIDG